LCALGLHAICKDGFASPFWLRGDGLMREHVVVLRLSARTHEEHDEEARAFESCFVPMIFFDQGEREVNAGVVPADV